ncbi:pyruvate kinase-like [Schistocerca cancellata]|uniref:pyruvate kinase-like n=1 Tax=Schistocerca cancellata TaxID=274614 RepID=UPI00211785E5|nr:pyruvate kinase-like [Schistocerca cancellata]
MGDEPLQPPWLSSGDGCARGWKDAATQLEHNASLRLGSLERARRLTATVCTVSPECVNEEEMDRLVEAGLTTCRLDPSRGSLEQLAAVLQALREAAARRGARLGLHWPISAALVTSGPAIHTGHLSGGFSAAIHLDPGDVVTLTTDRQYSESCSADNLYVDYEKITSVVNVGDTVLLDEGRISMIVKEVKRKSVICEVMKGGALASFKSVNLPGVTLDLPAVTERDRRNLQFGVEQGVDIIFAGSVRNAETVRKLRAELGEKGYEILIVAKVESEEAVENIDEILSEADGIAIGCGAAHVEMSPDKALLAQKLIAAKCNIAGKPAVCAARTGADVAAAVQDGADCVLLLEEATEESLREVAALCRAAEAAVWERQLTHDLLRAAAAPPPADPATAAAAAAVVAALLSRATAIVVLTVTGWSARCIARFRPQCALIAVTRNSGVARRLHVLRAVLPLLYMAPPLEDWPRDTDLRIQYALSFGLTQGIVGKGDAVVLVSGWRPGPGNTNKVRIMYAPPLSDEK